MLYVAGAGRSGTTLLAMLLGSVPGFVTIGETRHLWSRGVRDDELCSCGKSFRDCAFWSEVGVRAFGGWDPRKAERMIELQGQLDRFRSLPRLLAGAGSAAAVAAEEYLDSFRQLYQAIHDLTGRTAVDSSKAPSFLVLLGRRRDIDLRVIHLVRDSRAVVHSWTRHRILPDSGAGKQQPMATFQPHRSTLDWLANNLAIDLLGAGHGRLERVRYEALVAAPGATIRSALGPWLPSSQALDRIADGSIELGEQHIVAGNPVRFRAAGLRLALDDEWRAAMPRRHRIAVGAATWPLLRRYGYPLRTG